jgi:hypothetical protein
MSHKDFIRSSTSKHLIKLGLTRAQASSSASRMVTLWSHGTEYKKALDQIIKEANILIKAAKKEAKEIAKAKAKAA